MTEGPTGNASAQEPTLVERWLQDQQQWQRTLLTYLDTMVKNEDFLMHLGNAMRGSLLAGKPYPTAAPDAPPATAESADDRLDRVLFTLHKLEGLFQDVLMAVDGLRGQLDVRHPAPTSAPRRPARRTASPKRSATTTTARATQKKKRRKGA